MGSSNAATGRRGALRGMGGVRPLLRPALETLVAGVLGGYLIGIIAGQILPPPTGILPDEIREAHRFMGAVLTGDVETQVALMSDRDPLGRALQVKANSQGLEGAALQSMTFLGGRTLGRLSIQMYGLEARADDGRRGIVPFTLTLSSGKVVRIV